MPAFHTVHQVRHKPKDMYDIVADIRAYPQFVPMCTGMLVRSELERFGKKILIADMSVGYKAVQETFTSQVVLDPESYEIKTKYLEGPFSYLHNNWRFTPCSNALDKDCCDVDFSIDYEFRSKALGLLMGAMFNRAFSRFTAAFEARADEIYGRSPNSKRTT